MKEPIIREGDKFDQLTRKIEIMAIKKRLLYVKDTISTFNIIGSLTKSINK